MIVNEPAEETNFFTDDAQFIRDLLVKEWSLEADEQPNFEYEPEKYMSNARIGTIFVYLVSRTNQISSADYRTLHRESRVSIKVSCRYRERHFAWCNEVYRILMANRRLGQKYLNGNTYLEIVSEHIDNTPVGWYDTSIDIKLVTYNMPIKSAGFGDKINKEIQDSIKGDE